MYECINLAPGLGLSQATLFIGSAGSAGCVGATGAPYIALYLQGEMNQEARLVLHDVAKRQNDKINNDANNQLQNLNSPSRSSE